MKIVPSIIRALLLEKCDLEVEVIDGLWADGLLTHLYVPKDDLDIEIKLRTDGIIDVQTWSEAQFLSGRVFDPHDSDFLEEISNHLLSYCEDQEVHMRYRSEETRPNPETSQAP